ncbi:MAG: DNA primase [Haloferacaceae archaeon]
MAVDPRDARYPFLSTARRTVERLNVAPAELAAADAPAVERGVERVERALLSGTVAATEPERWRPRDELLSYPVARVLVSLLDAPAAVEKYAAAEARTARERLVADVEDDGHGRRDGRIDLDDLLAEFDLAGAVDRIDRDRFRLGVAPYLRLSDPEWGEDWRLVNRELADGRVPVEREECYHLLETAVRDRVAEGLPFPVGGEAGDALADALAEEVAGLRRLLANRIPRVAVAAVRPDAFPPCIRALVSRARDGEDLPPRSLTALLAFLAELGCDRERMAAITGIDPETVEFPATVLADDGRAQYPPPSCATMQAQGDCVNRDDRCETIAHPLAYYEGAVRDADGAGADAGNGNGAGDGADDPDDPGGGEEPASAPVTRDGDAAEPDAGTGDGSDAGT